MLAFLDTLIALLVFAGFALFAHLMRQRAAREQEDESNAAPAPPRPRQPGAPPQRKSWEEELRELLENRLPEPPVARDAPAPPPLVFAPPPESPAVPESHSEGPPPGRHFPPRPEVHVAHGILESARRFQHAASLHERVGQHLERASHHRSLAPSTHARDIPHEARRAVEMLRHRSDLRTALIASIILNPPKALSD